MIRKIVIGLGAVFALIVVLFVGAFIYAYVTVPSFSETVQSWVSRHPPTLTTCEDATESIENVSIENVSIEIENACRAAADAADPMAQYLMGEIAQRQAKSDPTKFAEAIKWYELSSKQNNRYAAYSLGEMFYSGKGVETDYGKALPLFLVAAKQKHAAAEIGLFDMYLRGKGVDVDEVQALSWLILTLESDEISREARAELISKRDKLMEHLTPEQRVRAQEIASKF